VQLIFCRLKRQIPYKQLASHRYSHYRCAPASKEKKEPRDEGPFFRCLNYQSELNTFNSPNSKEKLTGRPIIV
jgi:hypothetical protein